MQILAGHISALSILMDVDGWDQNLLGQQKPAEEGKNWAANLDEGRKAAFVGEEEEVGNMGG